jgi:hypothetical protein
MIQAAVSSICIRTGDRQVSLGLICGPEALVVGDSYMNDDHPYLEKRLGHKPYGHVRSWGKIAMWLVLIAIACGLILYLAVWANLIQ